MSTTQDLGTFDGRPVFHTAIKITKAGDGLSAALEIDPELMNLGERKFVVLETIVDEVEFKPIKGAPGVVRTHVLRTLAGTMVEASLVEAELLDQQLRIETARQEREQREAEQDRERQNPQRPTVDLDEATRQLQDLRRAIDAAKTKVLGPPSLGYHNDTAVVSIFQTLCRRAIGRPEVTGRREAERAAKGEVTLDVAVEEADAERSLADLEADHRERVMDHLADDDQVDEDDGADLL